MDDYSQLWYDCSHYDQYIEWDKVLAENVIIKCGGSLNVDEKFEEHADGAASRGKKIHLYYWGDPLENATEQAKHFISLKDKLRQKGIRVYSLLPDIEQWWADWQLWLQYKDTNPAMIPILPGSSISREGYLLCDSLRVTTPLPIIVYTGNWFVQGYSPQMLTWLPGFWLWLSSYIYSGDRVSVSWEQLYALQPQLGTYPKMITPSDKLILWQWTGDHFLVPGIWAVKLLRKKAIDASCYRGQIPAKDFFNYEGDEMTPILYYPCDRGFRLSQGFGLNPADYQTSGGHNGLDWAIPVGNKIYAAQPGYVIRAEQSTVGYGRHVRIQSADGITIYGHLSSMNVKQGDHVEAMQIIGMSGGATSDPYSGYSTGPHLHFEYRPNTPPNTGAPGTLAGAIDPTAYLKDHPTTVHVPVLFQAKCLVASLYIRSGPGTSYQGIGGIGYNEIKNVYEEKNGWFRVDEFAQAWCSGNPIYMQKIAGSEPQPEPEPPDPTVTITVLDWSKTITTWANASGFTGKAPDKY